MAFGLGDLVEISVSGIWVGQFWSNVWQYLITPTDPGITAGQLGEAWWNNVKANYRNMAVDSQGSAFNSVLVKSLTDLEGDYGTFSVPSGERAGTRVATVSPSPLPPANALGVRLAVATRVTRPGQKRLIGALEEDQAAGVYSGQFLVLANALMSQMDGQLVLGAPALLTTLDPVVVHKEADGSAFVSQPITGYSLNTNATTQASRRYGHGN